MKAIKHGIQRLFARYERYHAVGWSPLAWVGAIGAIAFPGFYLLRMFIGSLPERYDDLALRVVAAVFCGILAARKWWPKKIKRYYIPFSYVAVTYCLAFVLPFTLLENKGAINSVVNIVIGVVVVALLADWRNTAVMLISGYTLSLVAYLLGDPNGQSVIEFVSWWVPLSALLATSISISKVVEKRFELDRIQRMYNALAGSIAHEMRSPFTQAQHVLDRLNDALPAVPPTEPVLYTPQQIADMVLAVSQGHDAIKSGLQTVSVTLHQLKPEVADPLRFRFLSAARSVQRGVAEYAYQTPQQRQKVSVEAVEDFEFKGDETIFLMVLFNLMKNALYYLPLRPGARLTITIDGGGGGQSNRIVVRDTGPGIPPDQIAGLFRDFHSVDKAEGTGLGLSFCKRAMRAFGGDITCESELDVYTAFTLHFPKVGMADKEAHQKSVFAAAQAALAGTRVLVVDDDSTLRHVAVSKIALLGGRPDEAEDGQQALAKLSERPFDLIIMDVSMPRMDGLEATRRIRDGAVPECARVPILGHSSDDSAEAVARGRLAGMSAYIGKSSSLTDMAEAIVDLLGRKTPGQVVRNSAVLIGKTVLLAEDSPVLRAFVKNMLERLKLNVLEVEHGQAVLDLLARGIIPDAILMDIRMPGLDGLQTTRALREMRGAAGKIPVIALTGDTQGEQVAAARAAGMVGFLTKPVREDDLRAELCRVLDPVPGTATPKPPPTRAIELLHRDRLEAARRHGTLSLFPECLSEMQAHLQRANAGVAAKDLGQVREALHAMVGLSGEACTHALHGRVQSLYGQVVAGRWPEPDEWVEDLTDLLARSTAALNKAMAAWAEEADE